MQFRFDVDFKDVAAALRTEMPRQVPFAMAKTLTLLARDVKDAVTAELPVAFDRPTPFTKNALSSTMATKGALTAEVVFKQSQEASGKAKNEHIRPGAEGSSARSQKKTEYLLTRLGQLPPGWVTVPGNKMPLDGYGNLAGSYYKQIVNVLQLKVNTRYASGRAVSGASQKRAARMGVATEIFAVAPGTNALAKGGGWLPPGVYKHLPGRKLLQMLKFVKRARYSQRLDIEKIAAATVAKRLQTRWDEVAATTIATALKK